MLKVSLTNGGEVLVDDADAPVALSRRWRRLDGHRTSYAVAHVGERTVYLHRLLMAAPKGLEVDHVDSNGLDCRRSNMRLATRAQNQQNKRTTCGRALPKGVKPNGSGFMARLKAGGVTHHLGTFRTLQEAASAYDEAARKQFGPFARVA